MPLPLLEEIEIVVIIQAYGSRVTARDYTQVDLTICKHNQARVRHHWSKIVPDEQTEISHQRIQL